MPLIFNGNSPKNIQYNGNFVGTVKYGDTIVWQYRLPTGYIELEYIESDKASYINTGFYPNQDTTIRMKFMSAPTVQSVTSSALFYTSNAAGTRNYGFALNAGSASGKYRVYYGATDPFTGASKLAASTDYTIVLDKNKFYLNGTLRHTFATNTFAPNYPLPIFAQFYTSASPINYSTEGTRIYYFDIYDNGTPVRHLVPCMTTAGDIGMYDVLNSVFYPNLGSGTFIPGPIVLPHEYTKLSYVETDGACWIELNVVPDANTEFEITASNIIATSSQIMNAQADISNNYFVIGKASATQKIIGRIVNETLASSIDGVDQFTARLNPSSFYVNGTKVGDFTQTGLAGLGNVDLFRGKYTANIYYAPAGLRVHEVIIRKSGAEVLHGFPVKNTANELGIYDVVNGVFYTNKGTGSLIEPSSSVDLESNNLNSNTLSVTPEMLLGGKKVKYDIDDI